MSDKKDNINDNKLSQESKILHLKKQIIYAASVVGILIIFLSIIVVYNSHFRKTSDEQIINLTGSLDNLKFRTTEMEGKINDIKRYKEMWENADDKKNFSGIKIDYINSNFNDLANRYNIIEPKIKISVPEIIKDGVYNLQIFNVMLSKVSISFNALDDIKAIYFIRDLISNFGGYIIITDFSIIKTKITGYSEQELIDISAGKTIPAIGARLEFAWYNLKKKNI